MAIKIAGNQISDNAIATALIAANAVTPAKAALDSVWAFTALPTVNVDPSSSNDLVRKNYVDGLLQGLSWKKACKVRMTSNVNLSSPGATLDSQSMSSGIVFFVRPKRPIQKTGSMFITARQVRQQGQPTRIHILN